MLWQTAMLVMVVLFIFAAVGTASFSGDFALGKAADAVGDGDEDFQGCENLGQVRLADLMQSIGRSVQLREAVYFCGRYTVPPSDAAPEFELDCWQR